MCGLIIIETKEYLCYSTFTRVYYLHRSKNINTKLFFFLKENRFFNNTESLLRLLLYKVVCCLNLNKDATFISRIKKYVVELTVYDGTVT